MVPFFLSLLVASLHPPSPPATASILSFESLTDKLQKSVRGPVVRQWMVLISAQMRMLQPGNSSRWNRKGPFYRNHTKMKPAFTAHARATSAFQKHEWRLFMHFLQWWRDDLASKSSAGFSSVKKRFVSLFAPSWQVRAKICLDCMFIYWYTGMSAIMF